MKRIITLIVGLWAASWTEAEEQIHQMLPLAVGNSWEYQHVRIDTGTNAYFEQFVTISITHMEDIDGHTYYVFSDMPYKEPPVPYFFIAGKKVRWEGNHLLFRLEDRDVALYQFEDQDVYDYGIPETASDTLVVVDGHGSSFLPGWPRKGGCLVESYSDLRFTFIGHGRSLRSSDRWAFSDRWATIIKDFGMVQCVMVKKESRHTPILENGLFSWGGVIDGVTWDFWNDPRKAVAVSEESPCITESAIRALSWGVLKRKFSCPKCED